MELLAIVLGYIIAINQFNLRNYTTTGDLRAPIHDAFY